ncbi:MAG: DUF1211 domain-containing protein [Proteobacteria bacterium]|nr:DUF1211 domain-containing protein [Pseudomonadota bacterium]
MGSERLTAFTDGVIAVIITIMVLDLRAPASISLAGLLPVGPKLLAYALSFIYVAIYWNNHHHFFQLVPRVSGVLLWANLNLLFWLSLIPFATSWMGEHPFAAIPTATYGVSLLMPALSWALMQGAIMATQGKDSPLARAIGRDRKGRLTPLLYLAGIALAFLSTAVAQLIYAVVAMIWLVPDRRIEAVFRATE